MPEPTYLCFKLNDPIHRYKKVNVAGVFNGWNTKLNELKFDEKSKSWLLDLLVEMAVNEKVLYKYITDDTNWMCDETQPHESDDSGNENNLSYVILKDTLATVDIATVTNEDDIFDHKSFHEAELFDSSNPEFTDIVGSVPTSGDNENEVEDKSDEHNNADSPAESVKEIEDVKEDIKKVIDSTAVSEVVPAQNLKDEFDSYTLWESIKWFFRYYVLAWLYPQSSSK